MTSPNLVLALRLAGIVQLVITAANFFIPGKLGYARELPKLSPIVRQVHIIHHLYIVLVVFGLAVLSLFYPKELLSGTPLSRFLIGGIAGFWTLRVPIHLFYYDDELKNRNWKMHLLFTAMFVYLAAVFVAAGLIARG